MSKQLKYVLCFLISIWSLSIFAQNKKSLSRTGKVIPYKVYKTYDHTILIDDVIADSTLFKSAEEYTEKSYPKDIYWVRLDLKNELNTLATDSLWYLRLRHYEYASMFFNEGTFIRELKFGTFENILPQKSVLFSPGIPFSSKTLFQNRYIYLKLQRSIAHNTVNKWRFLYYDQSKIELLSNFYTNKDLKNIIPIYLFVGVCSVMFLFTLMFFVYAKRLEFLFYALYILFLVLYLTPDILCLNEIFFGKFSLLSYTFFQVAQIVINLCYILFVMYYLNTKTNYLKLHKVLKVIVYLLIVVFCLDILVLSTKQFIWHIYLLNFERLFMSVFGLGGMIYLLIKGKNRLAYFVVIGSFLYMFGALGFLFLSERMLMIIGSTLEIFVFAAGLTYKIEQENKEKLRLQQEAFINKTKALRAQINPHFIFNSLSSIQHLVTKNDKVASLKYLTKFSRLTRNILESSIGTSVILADEIKMLKDYLELESLRFEDSFNYNIIVEDDLEVNHIEVPILIIQPFVENAILHGLLHKTEGTKELTISFKKELNNLICSIDDNGIGRAAASKNKRTHKNKSRGLEVTKERLQMVNDSENNIEVVDKVDAKNKPHGTTVIIKINLS